MAPPMPQPEGTGGRGAQGANGPCGLDGLRQGHQVGRRTQEAESATLAPRPAVASDS